MTEAGRFTPAPRSRRARPGAPYLTASAEPNRASRLRDLRPISRSRFRNRRRGSPLSPRRGRGRVVGGYSPPLALRTRPRRLPGPTHGRQDAASGRAPRNGETSCRGRSGTSPNAAASMGPQLGSCGSASEHRPVLPMLNLQWGRPARAESPYGSPASPVRQHGVCAARSRIARRGACRFGGLFFHQFEQPEKLLAFFLGAQL